MRFRSLFFCEKSVAHHPLIISIEYGITRIIGQSGIYSLDSMLPAIASPRYLTNFSLYFYYVVVAANKVIGNKLIPGS